MDKLRAMQTFIQIVDTGSLTAAAVSMNSSLPATVRTLATLEQRLHVRLLNRTTRRISLTEEGRVFLERCRSILAEVDEAEAAVTARQAEPSGTLTVTAPVLFGQMHVAAAVTRFVKTYDQVRCKLLLEDRIVNLLEKNIDVAIRIGHLADSSLVAQQVSNDPARCGGKPRVFAQARPARTSERTRSRKLHLLPRAGSLSLDVSPGCARIYGAGQRQSGIQPGSRRRPSLRRRLGIQPIPRVPVAGKVPGNTCGLCSMISKPRRCRSALSTRTHASCRRERACSLNGSRRS